MALVGIIRTDRRANSTNGNASFDVTFIADGSQKIVKGRTRPNSQFTTTMPREGRALVEYHETPAGRIVFTNIANEV